MPGESLDGLSRAELEAEVAALRARVQELEAGQVEPGLSRRSLYLETLQRINATLRSTVPLPEVLATIARGAGETLGYLGALIVVPDEEEQCLRLGAAWGQPFLDSVPQIREVDLSPLSLPLTEIANPVVQAFHSGRIQAWTGASRRLVVGIEPQVAPKLAVILQQSMGAKLALCIPLSIGGQTVGVLIAFSARPEASADERSVLMGLADQAGLAIETARRFAETERLKAFNESIIQNMAEGLGVEDVDGRMLLVNPACAAMLGYRPEELLGKHRNVILPPDQVAIVDSSDGRRRQGQADHYQIDMLRQDGSRLPVLVSGSPRFDAAGRFAGTLSVFSDISERLQAEKDLQRRAQELAALYETSIEINSQRDLTTLLPAIVERATELMGMSMGSLYLLKPDGHTLELVVAHNLRGDLVGTTLQLGEGVAGRAAQTGQPFMVADHRCWESRAAVYRDTPFRRVLAAPMKVKQQVLGVVDVTHTEMTGLFTDDEVRLLSLFADQAAIAVESARLYEQAQQRLTALTVLFDASAAVSSSLDTEHVLRTMVDRIKSQLNAEGCAISSWDRDQDALVMLLDDVGAHQVASDPPGTLYPLADYPLSRQTLMTRQPVQVQSGDLRVDPQAHERMLAQGVKSMVMIPTIVRDDVIGVLEVLQYSSERVFTATEIGVCQTLANQMAAALENARLFQAERRQRSLAEALSRATAAVNSTLDLDQVLDRILEQVSTVFAGEAIGVILIDDAATHVVRGSGYDRFEPDQAIESVDIAVDSIPSFRQMFETGRPLVILDTHTDPAWVRIPKTAWVRSHCGAPIRVRGRVVGFLVVDSAIPRSFYPEQAEALQAFADSAGMAIQNASMYAESVKRNRELALLNRVIAASAASQEIEPILETVCRELALAFDIRAAAAVLLNEDRSQAILAALYPPVDKQQWLPDGERPALGQTFDTASHPALRSLIDHQLPLVFRDIATDVRAEPVRDMLIGLGAESVLLLPLVVENRTMGALMLISARPHDFSEEADLGRRVADQLAGALARTRLAETRQRLSIAVEQAAESIVITDTAGRIVYVNPAFERVTGYRQADAIGQTMRLLKSGKQDAAFYEQLWRTITSDQVWAGRFINRKRDGTLFTEEATISPVHNQAGEIVNYVAAKRDVTREVQLEEQFRQAQKMDAMGRLAGGIAHDFNNLLTVIQVSTWLLQRQVREEDPLHEPVQRIQDTVERAANLVKQLLSFSRHQIIEPRVLNLNQVVSDMSRMLQRIIGEDVRLVTKLAPDLWPVRIDPSQLEQVIMNVAINARDAMTGGGTITIETLNVVLDASYADYHIGAHLGEHVLLVISDTGIGMSDEVKSRLFEPFFTTKTKGQGTGLGLSTVFGIVNQNRGHIWVDSQPGVGTTLQIYLPRTADARYAGAQPEPTMEAGPGAETVLVVEDDPKVRELIARVLRARSYRLLIAENGPQAVEMSNTHPATIDLLLTDVNMPELNGKELADVLLGARPEMRVLYVSGYAGDTIGRHGILDPNVSVIAKPFSPAVLIHKVRAVLDAKKD